MRPILIYILVIGLGFATVTTLMPENSSAQPPATERLEIVTKEKIHIFDVEIADTEEESKTGLMFRKTLPPKGGMLFLFEKDRPITMWMKNTSLSLDMLFIARDGKILETVHNAKPFSTDYITARNPVAGVLEIHGGLCKLLGIKPGDIVRHHFFTSADSPLAQ